MKLDEIGEPAEGRALLIIVARKRYSHRAGELNWDPE